MDYHQRLNTLIESGKSAGSFSPGTDAVALSLSEEKQGAWKKLLGSIISAEAAEEKVMEPVFRAFASSPLIETYVRGHSQDEAKHARWIREYLASSFAFERKNASLGSKIIYGKVLPFISETVSARNPILILIVVYFYEVYSQFIYEEAKKSARRDELSSLAALIERIEKDERRHLAGIEAVTRYFQAEIRAFTQKDWLMAKAAIQVAKIDLAQASWAVHNRELARRVEVLGISSERWHDRRKIAEERCLQLLTQV
jgi:ribonucleotide reductase beta subunit family protein with ferritin-like domain